MATRAILMDAKEDLPMARRITSAGLELTTLPRGRYEIRITAHPEPAKHGRNTKWVMAKCNGHQIGMAKNFVRTLEQQGLVRIYLLGHQA